jgi:ferric-dicitrate binding protein FerR (iron transport regulator)
MSCRGGPPWPPVVRKHPLRGTGGHGGPPLQLHRSWIDALIVVIALLTVGVVPAQEPNETFEGFMHGIRANAMQGDAVYQRDGANLLLEPGLKLDAGDIIKTAPNAYAELLLQPGNYVRAAGDTELQLVNDQHDRMKLKLNRGTVSFEILSRDNLRIDPKGYDAGHLIRLVVPGTEVFIIESGIFRINTTPSGQTELVVRKGSAVIKGQEVKEKRRAVVSGDNVSITEIDTKIEDDFDAWARERAETLVRANKALKKTALWAKKKDDQEMSVDMPPDEARSANSLIVSAKPGTISFVEAGVEFSRAPDEWQDLTGETQLEPGDRLRTAANSFTEVMLVPDMYFRLGASSEVLFEHLSNDAVSIKLLNGSAILDVVLFDRRQSPQITIAAGATEVTITESGNFRLDNDAITIRRGKVKFNEKSVGSCHRIEAGAVSDCDKKRVDNLDYWSRYSGEGVYYWGASMAGYLQKSRRTRFRQTGFWFQNPEQTSYTFVPFTSEFFHSPYGGYYSTVLTPRRRFNRINTDDHRLPRTPGSQRLPNQP